jgi:hypothetical protein
MRRKNIPCPAYYCDLVTDINGEPVAIQLLEEDTVCTTITVHPQEGVNSALQDILPELRDLARSIYRKGYEHAQTDMRFALGFSVDDYTPST